MTKVLENSDMFREKYAKRAFDAVRLMKATAGGGAMASSVAGASAFAVGHAAAGASVWSLGTGLPWIGAFCAGKATAVGIAAGTAALSSMAVVGPALLVGGGVAYAIYRNRRKKTLHKGSGVSELAHAFARVAYLPMLALAIGVCQADPASTELVRDKVLKEMGSWGYSRSYAREMFDANLQGSPDEINSLYEQYVGQLKSGSTEGIGATPAELPANVVCGFAEEFRRGIEACIG